MNNASKTIAMADEFSTFKQSALIKVCGIGGGGGNAVTRMIEAGLGGVEFIAINTDVQDLRRSAATTRLQIGSEVTGGLGAGAKPDVGRRAAEEDREAIEQALRGTDMVFLTTGLGGGTGTGATPIVAEIAASTGALTVAIVTLPFSIEGIERKQNAVEGLRELDQHVDALIVVPNDRLAKLTHDKPFLSAFQQADEVLHNGVRAVSEIITVPGLVNVDFADVETIMRGGGRTLMGIGLAEGDQRARKSAEEAMVCPLLEQSTIEGAMGVIVNIRGGTDIGMREVHDAMSAVREVADDNANIIFGAVVDDEERPDLQVTVIASRFPKAASEVQPEDESNVVDFPAERAERDGDQAAFEEEPAEALGAVVELGQEPEVAAAPTPAAKVEEVREPVALDLFPVDEECEPEPEEDIRIPTYMRKRMKMREEEEQ